MPRASKSTSALEPASETLDTPPAADGVATPTRPEVQLRRSGRRIVQDTRGEDETREIQGKVMGIRPEGEEKQCEDSADDREEATKEGVQLAIEGLARMERRLMRANKTQKRKVETSLFQESLDPSHDNYHQPELLREVRLLKAEPVKHGQVPATTKEAVHITKKAKAKAAKSAAKGTEGDDADDQYVPDAEEETEEAVEVERGAARPPPVNSSYLPLPWKGRLGYVSSPSAT